MRTYLPLIFFVIMEPDNGADNIVYNVQLTDALVDALSKLGSYKSYNLFITFFSKNSSITSSLERSLLQKYFLDNFEFESQQIDTFFKTRVQSSSGLRIYTTQILKLLKISTIYVLENMLKRGKEIFYSSYVNFMSTQSGKIHEWATPSGFTFKYKSKTDTDDDEEEDGDDGDGDGEDMDIDDTSPFAKFIFSDAIVCFEKKKAVTNILFAMISTLFQEELFYPYVEYIQSSNSDAKKALAKEKLNKFLEKYSSDASHFKLTDDFYSYNIILDSENIGFVLLVDILPKQSMKHQMRPYLCRVFKENVFTLYREVYRILQNKFLKLNKQFNVKMWAVSESNADYNYYSEDPILLILRSVISSVVSFHFIGSDKSLRCVIRPSQIQIYSEIRLPLILRTKESFPAIEMDNYDDKAYDKDFFDIQDDVYKNVENDRPSELDDIITQKNAYTINLLFEQILDYIKKMNIDVSIPDYTNEYHVKVEDNDVLVALPVPPEVIVTSSSINGVYNFMRDIVDSFANESSLFQYKEK